MPVHDVNVKNRAAALDRLQRIGPELREIRRENGRD
jgi:hypothetical protein